MADSPAVTDLFHQLAQADCEVNGVAPMATTSAGNAMYAVRDVKAGEVVLRVPYKRLLNKPELLRSKSVTARRLARGSITSQQALTALLMLERTRGSESPWYTYIATLPPLETYESVALVVCKRRPELANLFPANVQEHLKRQLDQYERDQRAVTARLARVARGKDFSAHDSLFTWAWLSVNTRCLYYKVTHDGESMEENMTLSPLVDMLNHTPADGVDMQYSRIGMEMVADRDYRNGEEICLQYGHHTNATLFVEYGFCLRENPTRVLLLDSVLKPRMSLVHQEWLRERNYWADWAIDEDGSPSFRTEVALRAARVKGSDLIEDEGEGRLLRQMVEGMREAYAEDAVTRDLCMLLEESRQEADTKLSHMQQLAVRETEVKNALSNLELIWREQSELAVHCLDKLRT